MNGQTNKADTWWRTMSSNPLLRLLKQGELTTRYHSRERIPKSLTPKEILDIYMRETILQR